MPFDFKTLTFRPSSSVSDSFTPVEESYLFHGWGGSTGNALFFNGDYGYPYYRVPILVKTKQGTILAFAVAKSIASVDYSGQQIVCRRSEDNGNTWGPFITAAAPASQNDPALPQINSPTPVVDRISGTIWLLYNCYSNGVPQAGDPPSGFQYATFSTYESDGLEWEPSGPGYPTSDISANVSIWPYAAFGPHAGIQKAYAPFKNRLIVTAYHRSNAENSGIPFMHTVYNDDHSVPPNPQSWRRGSGVGDIAANQYSSEGSIVERKVAPNKGHLFIDCRITSGVDQDNDGQFRSEDGGLTWSEMVTGPYTRASVQHSMIYAGDHVYNSAPSHATLRKEMGLYFSHDDTETFEYVHLIGWEWNAYSHLCATDDGYLLIAYEKGHIQDWARYITLAKFSHGLIHDTGQAYNYSQWNFCEFPSGYTAMSGANYFFSINAYGPFDSHAQPSGSALCSYVDGRNGGSSIRLSSSGAASGDLIVLAEPGNSFFVSPVLSGFTMETFVRFPSGAGTGYFYNTNGSVLTSTTTSLQLTSSGTLTAVCRTGPTAPTTTTIASNYVINNGNWHYVMVRRSPVPYDTVELVIKDNSGNIAFSGVDTDKSTGNVGTSSSQMVLGALAGGTQHVSVDIDVFKWTRGRVDDADLLPYNYQKAFPVVPTYADDIDANFPTCQFWMPGYRRNNQYQDLYFCMPFPQTPVSGQGCHSMFDLGPSGYRLQAYDYDYWPYQGYHSGVGYTWRFTGKTSSAALGFIAKETIGKFDFIHKTGVFGISTFVKFSTPPSGQFTGFNMILDNMALGTSNGFSLYRQANDGNKIKLYLDDSSLIGVFDSTTVLSNDIWYHVAVSCSGSGTPITWYITPASTDADSITVTNSGTLLSTLGSGDSTYNLQIGHGADTNNGMYGEVVDVTIFNQPLTLAQVKTLNQTTKNWANRLS